MNKQKIVEVLALAIKDYGDSLTSFMEHPDDYKAFALNFISLECAKRCADALPPLVVFPSVAEFEEDLDGVKRAFGLPDDTPESLVGMIWRLQQRIEALEERGKDEDRVA